jgi:hypothetical protein
VEQVLATPEGDSTLQAWIRKQLPLLSQFKLPSPDDSFGLIDPPALVGVHTPPPSVDATSNKYNLLH